MVKVTFLMPTVELNIEFQKFDVKLNLKIDSFYMLYRN